MPRPRFRVWPTGRRIPPSRLAASVWVAIAVLAGTSSAAAHGAAGLGSVSAVAPGSNLSGTWTHFASDPDQPFARSGAAIGWDDADGLGVLYGGRGADGTVLNDTWVNDGDFPGFWDENPSDGGPSPPALTGAALSFDPTYGEFFLFGGELANGTAYGGTWAFGSFAWSDLTANLSVAPPPDASPQLAYDGTTGTLVLVSSADPGATWTYGAGGWHPTNASGWVSPRTSPSLVADPATEGVLLFGGRSTGADPQPLNDTWSWSTGGWERVPTPIAPPPEVSAPVSYDPRIPGIVLYSSAPTPSTWTYGAQGWSEESGLSPSARTGAQFGFDPAASYDSLFGGVAPNGTLLTDDWGWSVPPPAGDATLGASPVSWVTWAEVAAIIVVPIALVLYLRRRPPRRLPTEAPATAPASAPG